MMQPESRSLKENLERVKTLITGRHTTRSDARDGTGLPVHWSSKDAKLFGIYGAVYRAVLNNTDRHHVVLALRAQLPDQKLALAQHADREDPTPLIDAAIKEAA